MLFPPQVCMAQVCHSIPISDYSPGSAVVSLPGADVPGTPAPQPYLTTAVPTLAPQLYPMTVDTGYQLWLENIYSTPICTEASIRNHVLKIAYGNLYNSHRPLKAPVLNHTQWVHEWYPAHGPCHGAFPSYYATRIAT